MSWFPCPPIKKNPVKQKQPGWLREERRLVARPGLRTPSFPAYYKPKKKLRMQEQNPSFRCTWTATFASAKSTGDPPKPSDP